MEDAHRMLNAVTLLRRRFDELSQTLGDAARTLHAGEPPAEELVRLVEDARSQFFSVRATVISEAMQVGIMEARDRPIDNLERLQDVVDQLVVAYQEARNRQQRSRARQILERVAEIRLASGQDALALDACRRQARALLSKIDLKTGGNLPPEVDALVAGEHPLAQLAQLVLDPALDDTRWAYLLKEVAASMGTVVARAAVEGRLVMGSTEAAAAPMSHAPSRGTAVAFTSVATPAAVMQSPFGTPRPVSRAPAPAVASADGAALAEAVAQPGSPATLSSPVPFAVHPPAINAKPSMEASPSLTDAASSPPEIPPDGVPGSATPGDEHEAAVDGPETTGDLDRWPAGRGGLGETLGAVATGEFPGAAAPPSEPSPPLLAEAALSELDPDDDTGGEATLAAPTLEPIVEDMPEPRDGVAGEAVTSPNAPPLDVPGFARAASLETPPVFELPPVLELSAFRELAIRLGRSVATHRVRAQHRRRVAWSPRPPVLSAAPPQSGWLDIVERPAAAEWPPWRLDRHYKYSFSPAESAADIVRSFDARTSAATSEVIMDLVWRLILEERLGMAYLVKSYSDRCLSDRQATLPSWLLRALAVANHIRQPSGAIAGLLAGDLPALSDLPDPSPNQQWDVAVRMVVVASTLLPALMAPDTGAPATLRAACSGDTALSSELLAYARHIAQYGGLGYPVDPVVLRNVKDYASWEAQSRVLQENARRWWARASSMSMKLAAATMVWIKWLEPGQFVHSIIEPVLNDDVSRLPELRRIAARYASPSMVERIVHYTDRVLVGRRAPRNIEGDAMLQLRKQLSAALDLAHRWMALHSRSPKRKAGVEERLSDLMTHLEQLQAGVRQSLHGFIQSHSDDVMLRAGAQQCLHAVDAVRNMLNPGIELAGTEPVPRQLLHAEHLRLCTLSLDESWQPRVLEPCEPILDELLASIASQRSDWISTFASWKQRDNHQATGWILEHLRDCGDPHDEGAAIQTARQESLAALREHLDEEIRQTEDKLDKTVGLGLIPETQHSEYIAHIQDISLRQHEILDFGAPRRVLEAIRQNISSTLGKLREELLVKLKDDSIDDDARARIMDAIQADELLTASEYMEMLKAGSRLPISPDVTLVFKAFFPSGLNQIKVWWMGQRGGNPQHPLSHVRQRRSFAGIQMEGVPGKHAESALDMLQAWFRQKVDNKADTKLVHTILTQLGFTVTGIRREMAGHLEWLQVTTRVLQGRDECPVPAYGSGAAGRYRVLLYWTRPSEDQILHDTSESPPGAGPIVVFYFGILTEARRHGLGARCREQRRTLLVIDDALMLYVCGDRFVRLPTIFKCTLPFTYMEPYSTASGPVQPEMFYGRTRERASIVDPQGSCLIYGGRQLGKTALLLDVVRTFHDPARGRVAVWLDLKTQSIAQKHPIHDIWRLVATHLTQEGVLPPRPIAAPNEILDLIERWLREQPERRILLLLDEADRFLEADARDQFMRAAMLKGLMDRTNRRFKVVFAGLHNVKRSASLANSPLAHYNDPICIGPLLSHGEAREAKALVEVPMGSLGYRFERHAVMRILSQTNYYPSLIQLYCNLLLRHLIERQRNPPYTITYQDLIEVYQRKELRDAIRYRFSLTLELDPRYEVIAYVIALAVTRGEVEVTEGYSDQWILREAQMYWPEGFAKDRTDAPGRSGEDEFAGLLDEMVGLGVLREVINHRYTLRSPVVLQLLGTSEQIEAELAKSRTLHPTYDPATYHSSYRRADLSDPSRRNPLTVEAERILEHSPLAIVTGSEAAGLSEFANFVMASAPGNPTVLAAGATLERLLEACSVSGDAAAAERPVVLVDHSACWDRTWVEAARVAAAGGQVRPSVRLIFVADPRLTWKLVETWPSLFQAGAEAGLTLLNIGPWDTAAVWFWLDECGLRTSAQVQLAAETNNWPILLQMIYHAALDHHGSLEDIVSDIHDALASPDLASSITEEMGLLVDESIRPILHGIGLLQDLEQAISPHDLANVLQMEPPLVERVFHWASQLCLLRVAGGDHRTLDPIVGRVLEALAPKT